MPATGAATGPNAGGTFSYSFDYGVVKASDHGDRFANDFLTRIDATVGIPAGDQPRPVVFIVHGTYPECIDKESAPYLTSSDDTFDWAAVCVPPEGSAACEGDSESDSESDSVDTGPTWVRYNNGFSCLVNSLRQVGFVTVSIDSGAVNANFIGESGGSSVEYEYLIETHRKLLNDFATGKTHGLTLPANAATVLGSKQYAIVGHSTGGGFALQQGATNLDPNLFAAVGLQASLLGVPEEAAKRTDLRPTPTLALFGTCDEQISATDYPDVMKGWVDAFSTWPVSAFSLQGATHFGVNSFTNQADILAQSRGYEGCGGDGGILAPEQIQAGYAAAVTTFLQQAEQATGSDYTLATNSALTYVDVALQNVKVTKTPGDLPALDYSVPELQVVSEQLLSPWDPKAKPLTGSPRLTEPPHKPDAPLVRTSGRPV
ncbi:hypothetical protein JT358_10685 [Micrococcales bacterium 31B]|nr:hypothetical protein [Micrococcales bacterium 31B]